MTALGKEILSQYSLQCSIDTDGVKALERSAPYKGKFTHYHLIWEGAGILPLVFTNDPKSNTMSGEYRIEFYSVEGPGLNYLGNLEWGCESLGIENSRLKLNWDICSEHDLGPAAWIQVRGSSKTQFDPSLRPVFLELDLRKANYPIRTLCYFEEH